MGALADLEQFTLAPEEWSPRNEQERYRVYRRRGGWLELLATAPDAGGVGVALITLAEEGELEPNDRAGVLDSLASEELKGVWVLNPFAKG